MTNTPAKNKKEKKKKKGNGFGKKIFWAFLLMLCLGLSITVYELYKTIFSSNVILKNKQSGFLYIPSHATYSEVIEILKKKEILLNIESFDWLASRLDYKNHVHPGKYKLKPHMSNKDLIILLKSGRQTPVKITINNIRTKEELISKISKLVEADSTNLIQLLTSKEFLKPYALDPTNALSLIMPNSYEVYWNTDATKLLNKIGNNYLKFWNQERKQKAQNMELTPAEIIVLASIVEKETNKNAEKPEIAGVYINRLKSGRKLEADPTLVFASGDFNIRRVLNIHREIDSPYNTYKYEGLPPGPICMPSAASIDAVLNYEKHHFMYFCAKPDFSGFHQFSRTFEEHLIVARKFRKELGKRNIMN